MTNIDEKIKERQKQAVDRKIVSTSQFIVDTLGKSENKDWYERNGPDDEAHEERKGAFHDKKFHITTEFNSVSIYDTEGGWGDASSRTTILYKGKKVFEADGWSAWNIKTYLPGVWEKDLASLNTVAEKRETEKERKAAAAEKRIQARADAETRKEARKHFGL